MRYPNKSLPLVPALLLLTACATPMPVAVVCPVLPTVPAGLMQPAKNLWLLDGPVQPLLPSSKTAPKTLP